MRETNPRINEYEDYLTEHIGNVIRYWNEILGPKVAKDLPGVASRVGRIIANHDLSKYSDEEFWAYLDYFYPSPGFEKDEVEFNYAWLHHQHHNPHHWQYWVLKEDEGDLLALDMPLEYICEMICDWSSFSANNPDSTAYNWYQMNKDKMVLSEYTEEMLNYLLEFAKEPLSPVR